MAKILFIRHVISLSKYLANSIDGPFSGNNEVKCNTPKPWSRLIKVLYPKKS
jgi:hypothetical protein